MYCTGIIERGVYAQVDMEQGDLTEGRVHAQNGMKVLSCI